MTKFVAVSFVVFLVLLVVASLTGGGGVMSTTEFYVLAALLTGAGFGIAYVVELARFRWDMRRRRGRRRRASDAPKIADVD